MCCNKLRPNGYCFRRFYNTARCVLLYWVIFVGGFEKQAFCVECRRVDKAVKGNETRKRINKTAYKKIYSKKEWIAARCTFTLSCYRKVHFLCLFLHIIKEAMAWRKQLICTQKNKSRKKNHKYTHVQRYTAKCKHIHMRLIMFASNV